MRRVLAALALLALLLAGPLSSASPNDKTPTNLQAVFDSESKQVSLTWNPVMQGSANFDYPVWRDGTYVGTADGTSFTDVVGDTFPEVGLIYFVSSAPPGDTSNVSFPAVTGVSTAVGCEVVSTSTSWSPPFLHATLHMECLGMPYDKDATWTAPA